jgi:hypothetical protein
LAHTGHGRTLSGRALSQALQEAIDVSHCFLGTFLLIIIIITTIDHRERRQHANMPGFGRVDKRVCCVFNMCRQLDLRGQGLVTKGATHHVALFYDFHAKKFNDIIKGVQAARFQVVNIDGDRAHCFMLQYRRFVFSCKMNTTARTHFRATAYLLMFEPVGPLVFLATVMNELAPRTTQRSRLLASHLVTLHSLPGTITTEEEE